MRDINCLRKLDDTEKKANRVFVYSNTFLIVNNIIGNYLYRVSLDKKVETASSNNKESKIRIKGNANITKKELQIIVTP